MSILSDGSQLPPVFELLSIDVERLLDQIPRAELTYIDGDAARREFRLSDSDLFALGKPVEIRLGDLDDGPAETVFEGIVVRHGLEVRNGTSVLRVELKDRAVRMTGVRRSLGHSDSSEADVLTGLIERAGLEVGKVATGLPKQPVMVQYQATDWDFLLSRADVLGLVVTVVDGTVSVLEPTPLRSAQHWFEYGQDEILEFETLADAQNQVPSTQGLGWDLEKLALSAPEEGRAIELRQGTQGPARVARAIGARPREFVHPVPLPAKELSALASARLARSQLSLLRGRLCVPGFADLRLLDGLRLTGFGDRFNGDTLITGLRHRVDTSGWRTDLQFGLSPEWFCDRNGVREVPAAGLLPAVDGLQVAIVEQFAEDPDKQLRVKVRLPLLGDAADGLWARLAQPDAGKGRGFCFRPEPGDEVVLGFFNGDPRAPVILGALHSAKQPPPDAYAEPEENNLRKAIVTRSGVSLGFIDEDDKSAVHIETPAGTRVLLDDNSSDARSRPSGAVRIQTPDGNRVVLDDDQQSILIEDGHGNRVRMSKDGVVINSARDLDIDAKGAVTIKGSSVELK